MRSSTGIAVAIAALLCAAAAFIGLTQGRLPRPSAGARGSAGSRVILDSTGMCEMTVPSGWRPGTGNLIRAYGPGDSRVEILLGAGAARWEEEKTLTRNLFAGAPLRVLRDDARALTFEVAPAGQPGYVVVELRPGTHAGYCRLQLYSGSRDARVHLAADFAAIGASLRSRQ